MDLDLSNKGISYILAALTNMSDELRSEVQRLDLSNNNLGSISEENMIKLADAVAALPNLLKLSLLNNNLGDENEIKEVIANTLNNLK